jgi:hypothetical protein
MTALTRRIDPDVAQRPGRLIHIKADKQKGAQQAPFFDPRERPGLRFLPCSEFIPQRIGFQGPLVSKLQGAALDSLKALDLSAKPVDFSHAGGVLVVGYLEARHREAAAR